MAEFKSPPYRHVWLMYYLDAYPGVDTLDGDLRYHYGRYAAPTCCSSLVTWLQMLGDIYALAKKRLISIHCHRLPSDDGTEIESKFCRLTAMGEATVQHWHLRYGA